MKLNFESFSTRLNAGAGLAKTLAQSVIALKRSNLGWWLRFQHFIAEENYRYLHHGKADCYSMKKFVELEIRLELDIFQKASSSRNDAFIAAATAYTNRSGYSVYYNHYKHSKHANKPQLGAAISA